MLSFDEAFSRLSTNLWISNWAEEGRDRIVLVMGGPFRCCTLMSDLISDKWEESGFM